MQVLCCCEYSKNSYYLTTNQQQQLNNNNNDEFPNVHAEKIVDVYIPERVSRAETCAEEKSVGRVVVVIIVVVKEERIRC